MNEVVATAGIGYEKNRTGRKVNGSRVYRRTEDDEKGSP